MMLRAALAPAGDAPKSCCWREAGCELRTESPLASGVVGSGALAEKRLVCGAGYAMVL